MTAETLKQWIHKTEHQGFIDCADDFREGEFEYVLEIAKELQKRLEKEEKTCNLK